jgi:ketosteroid isomerase-like protein
MSTTEQTLSVVREAFEALQAHDLDAFRALLSEEVVLRDPSTGALQQGPAVIVADMRGSMEVFPDYRPGVENLFADGEQAVAEIVRTGTRIPGRWRCRADQSHRPAGRSACRSASSSGCARVRSSP